jgi:heme exporter protein A
MLDAHELTKSYGVRPVLRGVSLSVGPGQIVAVLGANGAGKTTLLRVLSTLGKPDGGRLSVAGIDALQHPNRARRLIGFVSHQPLVYPDLTGYENLLFYARLYGFDEQSPTDNRQSSIVNRQSSIDIEALLRRVNLHMRAHDLARTYSRGMLQRLAIARAMIHDPALILLDEPFTGLDQSSARSLSAMLRELAEAGKTLVMTTHEFGRGLESVTRAALLRGGRIAAELDAGVTPERVAAWFE